MNIDFYNYTHTQTNKTYEKWLINFRKEYTVKAGIKGAELYF